MFVSILGRQPELGLAELTRLYGSVSRLSATTAKIDTTSIAPERLGGSVKVGRVSAKLGKLQWRDVSNKIVHAYTQAWQHNDGKLTLGISAYGFKNCTPRDVQKIGLILKSRLKAKNVSLRLIPNDDTALSSASSHHNKLGLSSNKVELLIICADNGSVVVAESLGAQNITAYAKRDQGRPKRDAFVGMLPPKLAQILVNLAVGPLQPTSDAVVLDPFCGTGVILQEASLMGFGTYGSDLSQKMIDYSSENSHWLQTQYEKTILPRLEDADATEHIWRQPITTVACESYLGQPFSAPPSPAKLQEVRGNCNHIVGSFLKNISRQLTSGTELAVAVPAWKAHDGSFTRLPLVRDVESFGFEYIFSSSSPLLYYRDDQVVARDILVLKKS